jgi:hypothetical protein
MNMNFINKTIECNGMNSKHVNIHIMNVMESYSCKLLLNWGIHAAFSLHYSNMLLLSFTIISSVPIELGLETLKGFCEDTCGRGS